ncbi:alpha/beta hydrolase [Streptomyces dubilierae]|uniref:Palmitoyl-protein thioesterase ABHD10, mitochondrial n=1 Tax=Streptomyces dubilierae TaxID=3075533 RepID=A0ABU2PIU4_9ACTN|nr:alpha/beta fold hydrolase [Streptomyces sp. DSM 41921]MDT0391747.1 alpha/beta fold hydrolase [Streptomyces sp. DSM 41921]
MSVHDPTAPATAALPPAEDLFLHAAGQRLAATRVHTPDGAAPDVVHLHGFGTTASRHAVRYLLDDLAAHGHSSLTFEYSGNGESTGELERTTLRQRRNESLAAARLLDEDRRPVLLGTSMGAHLAAWTVPDLRPRALALFCPAAYPDSEADVRFGQERAKPGAYADSPAFAGIREFDGDLLVVAAGHDQVVPGSVIDAYLSHAVAARSRRLIRLDCDHFVHRWLPAQAEQRREVLGALRALVTDSLR